MNLEALGWSAFFADAWRRLQHEGCAPARVVQELRGFYCVRGKGGEMLAEVSGRLRHQTAAAGGSPAAGDWVAVEPRPGGERATIHAVLPRRSSFSRKVAGQRTQEQVVAANLDTVFVMTSLNRDLNLRRIERYLALVWEGGAQPVVLLSKADLCEDVAAAVDAVQAVAPGVPVHPLSARTGEGIEALSAYLRRGSTAGLLGSSGVGKSTLINRLLGADVLPVRAVRAGDDRGRHTTTSRQLILLPGGGMILDTPGLRELQLWDAESGMEQSFADIAALASECRFTDCSHTGEPDCAVQRARADGSLDAARYENYLKLQRELAFLARKQDAALQSAEEKRWRKVHQNLKRRSREKYGV